MAKYHIEEYSNEPNKYGFGMPLNMRRSNPDPLDNSSVVSSYEALTAYAAPKAEGDIAYVGQQVTVVKKSGDKFDVQAYQIADEAGKLRKLLYSDNATVDELSVGKLTVDFENLINGRSGSPYLNLSVLQLCIELSVNSLCCEVEDNYLNLSGGVIKQKGMHFGTLPEVEIRPKHIIVKGESNSDVGLVDSVTISCDRIVKDFGWKGTSDEPKTYFFPVSSGTLATEESVNGLVSSNYVWLSGSNTQAKTHAISGDNEFVGGKTSISALSIGTQLEYGDASGSWLSAKGTMLYTNLIDISANNADVTNGTGALKSSNYSHAEGNATSATGVCSHAEGFQTFAKMPYSHAEGFQTFAGDPTSLTSYGQGNHSEGGYTSAFGGSYNHAEGEDTLAFSSWGAHTEGNATSALNDFAHAEGIRTLANGEASKAEGLSSVAQGKGSHSEGNVTSAFGNCSHTEGHKSEASGNGSHAEGQGTESIGSCSHAEGYETSASGNWSHAEGNRTTAHGIYSHTEGFQTFASGYYAHAEGDGTRAMMQSSHAEGLSTTTSGEGSHAEGIETTAQGKGSHAEGIYSAAMHQYSFCWNGNQSTSYSSKHDGSFNINPIGDLKGFYIGDKNLSAYLSDELSTTLDEALEHDKLYLPLSGGDLKGDVTLSGNLSVNGFVTIDYKKADPGDPNGLLAVKYADISVVNGNYTQGGTRGDGKTETEGIPGEVYNFSFKNSFLQADEAFSGSSPYPSYGPATTGSKCYCILSVDALNKRLKLSGDIESTIAGHLGKLWSISLQQAAETTFTTIESFTQETSAGWVTLKNMPNGIAGLSSLSEEQLISIFTSDDNAFYTPQDPRVGNAIPKNFYGNFSSGGSTKAIGKYSHAEGRGTTADIRYSHAEGSFSFAGGMASHAEGTSVSALGDQSHAEGNKTLAKGDQSHAEGESTAANGNYSHAAGYKTTVDASYAFGWSGTSTSVYTVPSTRAGTFNIDPVGGISGFYIGNKSLNEIIGDDVLVSVDYLSGAIDALSDNLSIDIKNLSTSLSTEINNLSAKLSAEVDNLSGTHNFLSNAISSKVFISSYIDEEQMHGPSDLSIIKIAKDEYDALVADNHPTLSANTLYVVDSDYIDAYGQVISNLAMDENDPSYMLGIAATKPYVDCEVASLSAQLSGISKVIKEDSLLSNGISMSSEMSVILSAMVLIFSKLSAF